MTLQKIYRRFWDVAGSVSVRGKILGIVLGFILLLGVSVTLQARYALTVTMTTQLEDQSVSATRDLRPAQLTRSCSMISLVCMICWRK